MCFKIAEKHFKIAEKDFSDFFRVKNCIFATFFYNFVPVKYYLLASMPMFVCATLTLMMLFELAQRFTRSLRALTAFMVAATLLYAAHLVFFCRAADLLPFTDTIYNFCNPLVFPLLYMCYTSSVAASRVPSSCCPYCRGYAAARLWGCFIC